MRFLRAFAIGVITAVVRMFLAIFASDYLTRLYHVPDMEGQLLARKTKSGPTGHWQRSAQILLLFQRLKKSPFAIASARLAIDPVTAV
jgi:hypothetical protein